MKFSFDSKMVERKITIWQMAPLLWANILNIFMPYYVKVFFDRWLHFCHKKFALLIKVYMNTTVRQMAQLQQANIGNISMPKCVSVLWKVRQMVLLLQATICNILSMKHFNLMHFQTIALLCNFWQK